MTETTKTRHRIGEVCDLLIGEFPDISISKLRFLQDKGIVEPQRNAGGYRLYSDDDVLALRVALRMQRDEFMPLRVIKDELTRRLAEGRTGSPRPRVRSTTPGAVPAVLDVTRPAQLVSADALVRAVGISFEFLEECRAADVVSGQRSADGLHLYSTDEVELVRCANELTRLGLDLRHVRQAVVAVARQGAIVEQYAAAMLRAPGTDQRERALQSVEELTGQLVDLLRTAFVRDVRTMVERTTSGTSGQAAVPGNMPLV